MNDKLNTMQKQLAEIVDKKTQQERHKQNLQSIASLEKSVLSSVNGLTRYLDNRVSKTEVINQLKSISTPDVDKVVKAIEKLDSALAKKDVDFTPIVKSLSALEEQLKLIPKDHPDTPEAVETVTVSNLSEIDLKPLEKAIKGLKVNPEVHVKPEVNVEAPNLSPIKDALADVIDAIKLIPQAPVTDLSKVEKKLDKSNELLKEIVDKPMGGGGGGGNGTPYVDGTGRAVHVEVENGAIPTTDVALATRLDDSATPILYIGKAPVGSDEADPVWQIAKLDTSSGLTKTWSGNAGFTQVWSDRTSLTYS